MSTAAVMVVRDEADIIEPVVRHTLAHVDEIVVVDHRSTDGTREILAGLPVLLTRRDGRGLDGDAQRTRLAHIALGRGHDWALVVDGDDIWHTGEDDLRVADLLEHYAPDTLAVSAPVLDHVPTSADDPLESNPVRRTTWRRPLADARKVAFRLRPDLIYRNHNAEYNGEPAHPVPGLLVRHFSIRSADQLIRKVRNGMDAYDHSGRRDLVLEEGWERWRGLTDEQIRGVFCDEFHAHDVSNLGPVVATADGWVPLVNDPAPLRSGSCTTS